MMPGLKIPAFAWQAAIAALLLAAPALSACPNVGLAQRSATLRTDKGSFKYVLDVARTSDEQACGLMFRAAMPGDHGMLFPLQQARETAFWMENTPLPLDLVFVGSGGKVLRVARGEPFSRALIESGGIASAVVELNAGEAARIGLKAGDRVIY
jgi:uncharacterized membrane protein (UPF0127 family)